ncbi:MAG: HEAT repeat domain-containing protein [Cyanobacteria bacterium SID2]|nr:HEAT repeat domain-containing protein [Cyanobacteria bacterium SID2]MBP0005844.1 HEAT repeat domain-containing protein [Cyanobacteria bacterium SBC]
MSDTSHSNTQLFEIEQLSPTETDTLLQTVNQQLASKTFDSSDQKLVQLMIESLGDSRGMVRLGFAEALGQVGKPAMPFLLDALIHHPNVVVRRASAKTLTLITDPSAIPTLLNALFNDEDEVVKASSVGALARTGSASVPALLEILESPERSEKEKGYAAWALSFIGVEAKEQLYAAMTSNTPEVRCAVIAAIANFAEEHPEQRAFDLLIESLEQSETSVRNEAITALGKLSYKPAIPQLVELLQHPEGESRKSAALALMKIRDRTALDALRSALEREEDEAIAPVIQLSILQLSKVEDVEDT